MSKFNIYLIYSAILIVIYSCNIYSFSGTSISEDIKTVSINYIKNEAKLIQPNLSTLITETLINKCQVETNLSTISSGGDIDFYGKITKYNISPVAINNTEQATQNRLTITVEIRFINKFDTKGNFNKTFSQYADFNSNDNFSELEENLCEVIVNELIDDIFNFALVSW